MKDTISAIPNIHTRSTIEKKLHIARGKCMVICVCVSPDGAEMMLDLGLPASLIGGIVLPLLGAVPDSAMIIASGVGKSRDQANKEIAVGMGYVMWSTVVFNVHMTDYCAIDSHALQHGILTQYIVCSVQ